jgi:hypothetical protein
MAFSLSAGRIARFVPDWQLTSIAAQAMTAFWTTPLRNLKLSIPATSGSHFHGLFLHFDGSGSTCGSLSQEPAEGVERSWTVLA